MGCQRAGPERTLAPAAQAPSNGVNLGGIDRAFTGTAGADSYLTIGLTAGNIGDSQLSAIGIDFDAWSLDASEPRLDSRLFVADGAVFVYDSNTRAANHRVPTVLYLAPCALHFGH